MAKLRPDSILRADLEEYIETASDFAFELRVLELLSRFGLHCEHAGSYEDPVTKKTREFDIRATAISNSKTVRLAVECKNVRENFPVLISRVPRRGEESYHQIAIMREPGVEINGYVRSTVTTPRAEVINIRGAHSIYRAGEPVGKSTAQVGRAPGNDRSLVVGDSELYEKWGQALASVSDLVERMYWDDREDVMFGFALPVVVIPDGRLWVVDYESNGMSKGEPVQIDHCSCYVNKDYEMGNKIARVWYNITHIEVMTFSGLQRFVQEFLYYQDGLATFFSKDGLEKALREGRKS